MWIWFVKIFDSDSIKYLGEIYWSSILHIFVREFWVCFESKLILLHSLGALSSKSFDLALLSLFSCDSKSLCLHCGLACSIPVFQGPCCISTSRAHLVLHQHSFWSMFVPKGKMQYEKNTSPLLFVNANV